MEWGCEREININFILIHLGSNMVISKKLQSYMVFGSLEHKKKGYIFSSPRTQKKKKKTQKYSTCMGDKKQILP